MIETIPNMPAGTFRFRVHGQIAPQDYRDVVLPPLRAAVENGEGLRVRVAIGLGLHEELVLGNRIGRVFEMMPSCLRDAARASITGHALHCYPNCY
jgi:hypothetical protein